MTTTVKHIADMFCATREEYDAAMAYLAALPPGQITKQASSKTQLVIHVEWTNPDWKPL